jgi:hypothetical protein
MFSYLFLPRQTSNSLLSLLATVMCFLPINLAHPTVKKCSDIYYQKWRVVAVLIYTVLKVTHYLSVCNFEAKNLLCLCFVDWGLFDFLLGLRMKNKTVVSDTPLYTCAWCSKSLKHFSLKTMLMKKQKSFKYADSRIWHINEVNYKYKNI